MEVALNTMSASTVSKKRMTQGRSTQRLLAGNLGALCKKFTPLRISCARPSRRFSGRSCSSFRFWTSISLLNITVRELGKFPGAKFMGLRMTVVLDQLSRNRHAFETGHSDSGAGCFKTQSARLSRLKHLRIRSCAEMLRTCQPSCALPMSGGPQESLVLKPKEAGDRTCVERPRRDKTRTMHKLQQCRAKSWYTWYTTGIPLLRLAHCAPHCARGDRLKEGVHWICHTPSHSDAMDLC